MYQVTSAAKELEAPATTETELFERMSVYTNSVVRVQHVNSHYWMNVISTGLLTSAQIRTSTGGYDPEDSLYVRIGGEEWVRLTVKSKVSVLLDGSWKVIHDDLPNLEYEAEDTPNSRIVFEDDYEDEYEE